MNKKMILVLTLAGLTSITLGAIMVKAIPDPHPHFGPLGTVYVSGQGLYYDTFVPTAIPYTGENDNSFQLLSAGVTEFGPGDAGYKGGRWWVDVNANGYPDPDDVFVLCPLLGPGRTSP